MNNFLYVLFLKCVWIKCVCSFQTDPNFVSWKIGWSHYCFTWRLVFHCHLAWRSRSCRPRLWGKSARLAMEMPTRRTESRDNSFRSAHWSLLWGEQSFWDTKFRKIHGHKSALNCTFGPFFVQISLGTRQLLCLKLSPTYSFPDSRTWPN